MNATAVKTEQGTPYLTFTANGDAYALGVVGAIDIIPYASHGLEGVDSDFLLGTVSYKGQRIPVLDMFDCLGFQKRRDHAKRSVVVVRLNHEGREVLAGFLVSSVKQIFLNSGIELPATQECLSDLFACFMQAMSRAHRHYSMVLHPKQLMFPEQLNELASVVH